MAGVQGIVSAGNDPLAVPVAVIEEIRSRGTNGVVRIEDHFKATERPFDHPVRALVCRGDRSSLESRSEVGRSREGRRRLRRRESHGAILWYSRRKA